MTDEWQSLTHRFAISGHKWYVTVATGEPGRPDLLEIRMAKTGGVLRGLLDALASRVSLGLRLPGDGAVYQSALAVKGETCSVGEGAVTATRQVPPPPRSRVRGVANEQPSALPADDWHLEWMPPEVIEEGLEAREVLTRGRRAGWCTSAAYA